MARINIVNFLSLISICITLNGCVKDLESKIDLTKVAEIKIDDDTNYTLSANSEKLYKISFLVKENSYGIENGKDVFFSIDKGKLIDPINMNQESESITIKIINNAAEVFYRPDHSSSSNIELVAKIEPFRITQQIKTMPVLPQTIHFDQELYVTNKAASLEMNAVLQSTQGKVSSNLDIEFSYITLGSNESVINIIPALTKSVQTSEELYTKASTQIKNISETVDTILIIVKYNNIAYDTATVFFND